jgi:hypothetical protein
VKLPAGAGQLYLIDPAVRKIITDGAAATYVTIDLEQHGSRPFPPLRCAFARRE